MLNKSISYDAVKLASMDMRSRENQILVLMRDLVEVESPSDDKAAVDRCVDLASADVHGAGRAVAAASAA